MIISVNIGFLKVNIGYLIVDAMLCFCLFLDFVFNKIIQKSNATNDVVIPKFTS